VIDENVHAQNTLKLSYELQRAGKPFRLMMDEKSRHGLTDPALVKHMRADDVRFHAGDAGRREKRPDQHRAVMLCVLSL
jgi:hypothetical protein